jgi:hypothetical protein
MARQSKQAETKPTRQCDGCEAQVGDEVKVTPVFVQSECWCPVCFYIDRMSREPGRWHAVAVYCERCKYTTLSVGHRLVCGHCNCPSVVVAKR